ncbi:MAG: DUF4466 family protein [Bacteroidales bacterium]|nr:DUF4466 family protein [Bacteroidales bacterium]
MKKVIESLIPAILALSALLCSCSGNVNRIQVTDKLGNDCINRYYYVPYIVGTTMEFAYAMFMPSGSGRLESASVECSFPGAEGTFLEHRAYSTDDYGQDLPHQIGNPCTESGSKYTVEFVRDTTAATLRFYYVIPEEARGKDVSFHFTCTASTGETVSYDIEPCHVRNMTMKLDIKMTQAQCYFSLATLEAYTAAQAEFNEIPIDFVWGYSTDFADKSNRSTFINPACVGEFTDFFDIKTSGLKMNDTRKMYKFNIIEPQLGRQEFDGFYIDDRDFLSLDLNCDTHWIPGINNRTGFWVETADGKYRAYIYCNAVSADNCTVSVKRYTMF